MTQCKEGSQREGLMLDSAEELYKWFTQQVGIYTLHKTHTHTHTSKHIWRSLCTKALYT